MQVTVNEAVREILTVKDEVHNVPLQDIRTSFYVRVAVDEDRVMMFSEMLESGKKLPPILVTEETHLLVDGRTRIAAYERLDLKRIPCVFCNEADEQTLITAAYLANADPQASLPPTRLDIRHTIELMLRAGKPKKQIRECFEQSLGVRLFRQYLKHAESKIRLQQISRARASVAEGRMSVKEAAEHYGVKISALRAAIRGVKPGGEEEKVIGPIKAAFSSAARRFSAVLAQHFRYNVELLATGELTEEDFKELLAHERHLVAGIAKAHEDRRKRLEKHLE